MPVLKIGLREFSAVERDAVVDLRMQPCEGPVRAAGPDMGRLAVFAHDDELVVRKAMRRRHAPVQVDLAFQLCRCLAVLIVAGSLHRAVGENHVRPASACDQALDQVIEVKLEQRAVDLQFCVLAHGVDNAADGLAQFTAQELHQRAGDVVREVALERLRRVEPVLLGIAADELREDDASVEERIGLGSGRCTEHDGNPRAGVRFVLLQLIGLADHGGDSVAQLIPHRAVKNGVMCPGKRLKRPRARRTRFSRLGHIGLEALQIGQDFDHPARAIVAHFNLKTQTAVNRADFAVRL